MEKYLGLLGLKARDKITSVEGIITSVSFDLFGCIQVVMNAGVDENGKLKDIHWYDANRLEIISHTPVMKQPNFKLKELAPENYDNGPAEKPAFNK